MRTSFAVRALSDDPAEPDLVFAVRTETESHAIRIVADLLSHRDHARLSAKAFLGDEVLDLAPGEVRLVHPAGEQKSVRATPVVQVEAVAPITAAGTTGFDARE